MPINGVVYVILAGVTFRFNVKVESSQTFFVVSQYCTGLEYDLLAALNVIVVVFCIAYTALSICSRA